MTTRTAAQRAAKIAEAAAYGRALGANGAAHYFYGIGADDAKRVLVLARRGELDAVTFADTIAERVTAQSLARDLGVRPGTELAADMHAAMVAAWGPAFYDHAAGIAQAALSGELHLGP